MKQLNIDYNVPADTTLHIYHLHGGNSSNKQRKGHAYVTIAKLVLKDGNVLQATAACSKHDVPSRKRGRDIAIGRVLKSYASTN